MITTSIIDVKVYENLLDIIRRKQLYKDIDKTLLSYIGTLLRESPQWVVHDTNWQGFLVMYQKGSKVTFNPWIFGGLPLCKDGCSLAGPIFEKAIEVCKNRKIMEDSMEQNDIKSINKLVMILNHHRYLDYNNIIDHNFIYDYDYCDLELDIESFNLDGVLYKPKTLSSNCKIVPLKEVPAADVKQLYHQTFALSDAMFYSLQTTLEKVEFFKYLNYDLAIKCDETLGILCHNQFIGFVMTTDAGEHSRNIICMCIRPDFQNKGFGSLLLNQVIKLAKKEKVKKIFLGTELQMNAFNLYRNWGFHVTGTSNYYHFDL